MKNKFFQTFLILYTLCNFNLFAQDFQWAYSLGNPPLTKPSSIKRDLSGNFYLATHRDSSNYHLNSILEKRNDAQQLLWQKDLQGDVVISDLEVNPSNHVVVIGYYNDSLNIDGNIILNPVADYVGFIFEADENGNILWLHNLNPIGVQFKPFDLFIEHFGLMYITADLGGGSADFTSFHKLDQVGNIIKSKFNNDFEIRTYTNIIADNSGNVYISGTCGSGANFDTIPSNPNYSYQNYLIKYDPDFIAQWFTSRNYITFDDNNRLQTDGQNLFWAFDDFTYSSTDTVKVVKVDYNGNVLSDFPGPLSQAFFPAINFSMDSTGYSVLTFEIYTRLYLYRFDPSFNIVWSDTIMTQASGFPSSARITCYDSTFYLAGSFYKDTLEVGNYTLYNSNLGANQRADLFVSKWGLSTSTGIMNGTTSIDYSLYPNPVNDLIEIKGIQTSQKSLEINIYDELGTLLLEEKTESNKFSVSSLPSGIYILSLNDGIKNIRFRFVKM